MSAPSKDVIDSTPIIVSFTSIFFIKLTNINKIYVILPGQDKSVNTNTEF